jgi:hypothetical protein
MRVTQHGPMERCAALIRVSQVCDGNAQTFPCDLHVRGVLRAVVAHYDGQPGYAFAADDADFNAGFARTIGDYRCKAGLDEIDTPPYRRDA